MFQRFIQVLLLNKNQTTIQWRKRTITISRREKRLGRIAQGVVEFVPLFLIFSVLAEIERFSHFQAASLQGFLIVTAMILLTFAAALLAAFLFYWIGMRKELK